MEEEQINEEKAPKTNEDETLNNFFKGLNFLTSVTPEDDSINYDNLLDELIALEPETQQNFKRFLFEHSGNQLVKMVFNLKKHGNIDKAKERIKEEAKETQKTIYRTIVYPKDPAPSPEDPFVVSLQNDMNDLRRLINELFPHNNATENPKKVFYSHMVISAIINDLRLFDTNPLLLLSEQAAYYINSNFLQAIIESLSKEERYASELQLLKDSDQLRDKILSIIISKDKIYLGSLIDQSSENIAITINKILNMAIEYGAYFMAEFALEQWSLYFENHQLTKESYRQLVSLVGHALIRSNTEICLLLTKPEMWKFYIEEDQLRLLELVMYRTGESTKKILISNMKDNGFLNLELCQKIPAKTEYQRKIIKAILDEYNEYYQEMLDNIKEILAENQKDKIELLISNFNSLPKEWQQKLTKKYGKIKFIVKNIESPGASKLLQSLEEQETNNQKAPKTKAKETKSSDQSLADAELIKLFGEKPKAKETNNSKEPEKKSKKTKAKEIKDSSDIKKDKSIKQEDEKPKTKETKNSKEPEKKSKEIKSSDESPATLKLVQSLEEQKNKSKETEPKENKDSDIKIAEPLKTVTNHEEVVIKTQSLTVPMEVQEEVLDAQKEKAKRKRKKSTQNVKAEVPQKIVTEEPEIPKKQDVISLDKEEIPQETKEHLPIIEGSKKRYIVVREDGVLVLIDQCPHTGKVFEELFYQVLPTNNGSTAKETTPPTAGSIKKTEESPVESRPHEAIIVRKVEGNHDVKCVIQRNIFTGEITCIYYTEKKGIISFVSPPAATRKSESPKTQNVKTVTEEDVKISLGDSDNPTQKTEEISAKLNPPIKRYIAKQADGVLVLIDQCPHTKKVVSKEYLYPVLQGSNNGSTAEETTTTASTETNKAGETKADLAGGKKLAADNNSQSSYSLTAKVVVEFNLSLSSSLIYEEVKNTEQDEYKESIEQVEQRSEDQSANIQFENITTEQEDSLFGNLHNNSFIPLLPSDKQEFSLPFLIIGDPLEAGKVLGMVENLNYLENIAM